MVINIEKKQITVGCVIIAVIGAAFFGITHVREKEYLGMLAHSRGTIYQFYYMSSLLSQTIRHVGGSYCINHKEYIDRSTGKFFSYCDDIPDHVNEDSVRYCVNLSDAVEEKLRYCRKKGIQQALESLHNVNKSSLRKMASPPRKYESVYKDICELFSTAETMYNCTVSPEGTPGAFATRIYQLSVDYEKQSSRIDIQLGKIAPKVQEALDFDVLSKFIIL